MSDLVQGQSSASFCWSRVSIESFPSLFTRSKRLSSHLVVQRSSRQNGTRLQVGDWVPDGPHNFVKKHSFNMSKPIQRRKVADQCHVWLSIEVTSFVHTVLFSEAGPA